VRELRNRVVQVRRFGGPDGLEVVDAPLPKAGRGEVRVRMLASGLEYTDVVIRRRLYPQTMRRRPPFLLGYDVVGEIDQLGDGVSGFQLGDRVADLTVLGSNAAYCTLRADRLTRVPAGLDAAEEAALILSWTTAYQLLHHAARVRRGQNALVQGVELDRVGPAHAESRSPLRDTSAKNPVGPPNGNFKAAGSLRCFARTQRLSLSVCPGPRPAACIGPAGFWAAPTRVPHPATAGAVKASAHQL
jgi:hypothetical protein